MRFQPFVIDEMADCLRVQIGGEGRVEKNQVITRGRRLQAEHIACLHPRMRLFPLGEQIAQAGDAIGIAVGKKHARCAAR